MAAADSKNGKGEQIEGKSSTCSVKRRLTRPVRRINKKLGSN